MYTAGKFVSERLREHAAYDNERGTSIAMVTCDVCANDSVNHRDGGTNAAVHTDFFSVIIYPPPNHSIVQLCSPFIDYRLLRVRARRVW